jgi:hypothetical protein
MVPQTFPSTYETANGQQRMVVFFLSSVSGLEKWVDYIPVKFATLEAQENNSYNNNGVILVDPLSSTTNLQEWKDYIPVFADATADNAWTVSSDGFIPVGYFTKPTLALDFANMTTLDSRITFTRASDATYFDSSGVLQTAASGVARFDHNPTTLAPLGLLIEEQRTNLVTYSAEFDNAAWTKTRSSITANTIVAPDGTLTGDTLNPNIDGLTNTRSIRQTYTTSTNGTYTFSIYVKLGTVSSNGVGLVVRDETSSNNFRANFNLFTLATPTVSVLGTWVAGTASVQSVGNNWVRVSISGTTNTAHTSLTAEIYLSAFTLVPDTIGTIFIWGAQLEAGAFPTSYIPTVAAAATRNADAASMTSTNFSSWYRADEGTFYSESVVGQIGVGSVTLAASDATASNRLQIQRTAGNNYQNLVVVGGVTQSSVSVSGVAANVSGKSADAFKLNDFNTAVNGVLGTADTSGTVPTVTQLDIGSRASSLFLNGIIRKIAFYPTRLSNAQLVALTR